MRKFLHSLTFVTVALLCHVQASGKQIYRFQETHAVSLVDSIEIEPAQVNKSLTVIDSISQADAAAVATAAAAVAAVDSAAQPKKRNFFQRVIDYFGKANKEDYSKPFDFSIIGGPYYASDTKFGIGLVAAGLYRTDRSDTLLQRSSVSLKASISTSLFYAFAINGMHIFPKDFARINYNFEFAVLPTYFWGIGYQHGADYNNKTKFKDLRFNVNVDGQFRCTDNLFVGPVIYGGIASANKIEDPSFFDGIQQRVTSFGGGFVLSYDSRDYPSDAYSGWYVRAMGLIMPKFAGNFGSTYWKTEFAVSNYFKAWRGAHIAWRLASTLCFGDVPWSQMPTFGDKSMRGYYFGQYRDKCASDVTLELRQRIWKRIGAVVWVGAGTVFSDFKHLKDTRILPNAGVGFRWEFKKRVNVRLDVGFGKNTYGFEFNINEAF